MKTTESPRPLRADVVESARLLGISRAHFYKHVKAGRIKVQKDGRRTLVAMSELERFAAQSGNAA